MKINISHQKLLDPKHCADVINELAQALVTPSDGIKGVGVLSSFLLQAQVAGPEDEHHLCEMMKVIGGNLASRENNDSPSLGELLRVIAKVSHNAGLGMDSVVDIKSTGVIVTTG